MADGNWKVGAGIGDANIAVAQRAIVAALNSAAKNREVLAHPVMLDMMFRDALLGPMLGALGVSESLVTVGTAKLVASVEENDDTAIVFATSNTTAITPARHAHARQASDYARAVQEKLLSGEISPTVYALLIYEGVHVWANTVLDKLAALFPSLSNNIGTTNTDLTWTALQNGIIDAKDRGIRGRGLGLLDTVGAKDLMNNAVSLGGAVQWSSGAQSAIANAETAAYLFSEWGVDFYLNGELDDDGTDRSGAVLWPGCVQTKHARVPLPPEAIQVADGGWWTMEARRTGGSSTRFDIVSHLAAQIRENARGSRLIYGLT